MASSTTTTFDYSAKITFGTRVVEVKTRVTQTSKEGQILPVPITDPSNAANVTPLFPTGIGFQRSPAPTNSIQTSISTPSNAAAKTSAPLVSRSPSAHSSSTLTPSRKTSASSQTQGRESGSTKNPNPPQKPNHSSNSNPISSGAAAGIGIGSAAAGALIAAFIVWLLMRRSRRSRRPARTESIRLNGFASTGKAGPGGNSSDVSSAAAVVERTLPQPADDQAISGEISRLRTLIKNHAQSYYHSSPARASATGVDQAALGAIAMGNMPIITSTLTSLLSNPSTRMSAIRFCIAWTAISRIDLGCEPVASFLPPEIATCLVSMTGMRDDPQSRLRHYEN